VSGGAGETGIALGVDHLQALPEALHGQIAVAGVTRVKTDQDQGAAREMDIALIGIELEDLRELLCCWDELPKVGEERGLELQ
jgi:hypothetical protein